MTALRTRSDARPLAAGARRRTRLDARRERGGLTLLGRAVHRSRRSRGQLEVSRARRARARAQLRDEAARPHRLHAVVAGARARQLSARASSTTSAEPKAIWPTPNATPRLAAPASSATPTASANAAASERHGPPAASGASPALRPARHRSSSSARPRRGPARRAAAPPRGGRPARAAPRSPCSDVNSRERPPAAAPRTRRTAARSSAVAVLVERVGQLARSRSAAAPRTPPPPARRASPTAPSACAEVAPRARGRVAEVRLRHDEHVGHLHDPRLQELEHVAGRRAAPPRRPCRRRPRRRSPTGRRRPSRRPRRRTPRASAVGRLARGARQPAEPPAGGGRADQDAVVARVVLDPRAVAEQRAAGALRGRVHGEHRHGRPAPRQSATSADSSDDLPAPGGPVTPDQVRRRLAAERGGRDLRRAAPRPRPRGRAVLDQVERGRRGGAVAARAGGGPSSAAGQARRYGRPRSTPWRSATRSTMSPMIRLTSKSFGV